MANLREKGKRGLTDMGVHVGGGEGKERKEREGEHVRNRLGKANDQPENTSSVRRTRAKAEKRERRGRWRANAPSPFPFYLSPLTVPDNCSFDRRRVSRMVRRKRKLDRFPPRALTGPRIAALIQSPVNCEQWRPSTHARNGSQRRQSSPIRGVVGVGSRLNQRIKNDRRFVWTHNLIRCLVGNKGTNCLRRQTTSIPRRR